ncbi:hypothetical protein [Sphingomonas sp. GM_Shp_1]|uniref:hypothetical protein n=1 Tax=Sphingomonas sp. GM_Shp_1 TaxID=2937381 RepID=UPI00226B0947|nr:hypothetical protein [Sphingomonas sp. GM_Shp_1]
MLWFPDHTVPDFMQWFAKRLLQTIADVIARLHDIPDTGANQERVYDDEDSAVLRIYGCSGDGIGQRAGLCSGE